MKHQKRRIQSWGYDQTAQWCQEITLINAKSTTVRYNLISSKDKPGGLHPSCKCHSAARASPRGMDARSKCSEKNMIETFHTIFIKQIC